ncbi:snRNA-activating protein complex subunit 2 [Hirundo rustica]|uniref:snRNA-activating protein complex subunit 2 n=1 Tax=Hirundo rustica TaxID=43150 RepID=UPI001A94BA8F|nr:snRNA-activating protein complex subunit 2 [Hirundo rustica]
MKPPWRHRLLPARFAKPPPSPERLPRGVWGLREKGTLLAALRAQARRGLPEQLLPAALRQKLPHRSEEEIQAVLVRLRGRVARETLTSKFRNFLHFQRRIRAPIQVWQDLAETLGGGALEGPPSVAFSQVLTVAATEPLTLKHSGPPPNSGTPQNSGSAPGAAGLEVDFGKIYEFLAQISAGGEAAPLPPAEAAVVLSLLGALPAQLGALGALGSLRHHFRELWGSLSAPQSPGGPPQSPAPSQCPPLNPLLVPLGLLGGVA